MLPTESAKSYETSLGALIQEMEADTPLKAYLAENIHECILWIRRYQQHKQMVILRHVALILLKRQSGRPSYDSMSIKASDADFLFQKLLRDLADPEVEAYLEEARTTMESLQAQAMLDGSFELAQVDSAIERQFKLLRGLQSEYERLENRTLKRQYLELQVENLRRNVHAIENNEPHTAIGQPQ